jgi:hypothetical protein
VKNVRRETSRHLTENKGEYLRGKFSAFKTRVRTMVLDTCIGASNNLRRISLELTY